jgi:hypothetical protein
MKHRILVINNLATNGKLGPHARYINLLQLITKFARSCRRNIYLSGEFFSLLMVYLAVRDQSSLTSNAALVRD